MGIRIDDVKVYTVTNQKDEKYLVLGTSRIEVEEYVKNDRCQFDCSVNKNFTVEENTDKSVRFFVGDLNNDCFSMECDQSKYTYKADTEVILENMDILVSQQLEIQASPNKQNYRPELG